MIVADMTTIMAITSDRELAVCEPSNASHFSRAHSSQTEHHCPTQQLWSIKRKNRHSTPAPQRCHHRSVQMIIAKDLELNASYRSLAELTSRQVFSDVRVITNQPFFQTELAVYKINLLTFMWIERLIGIYMYTLRLSAETLSIAVVKHIPHVYH